MTNLSYITTALNALGILSPFQWYVSAVLFFLALGVLIGVLSRK